MVNSSIMKENREKIGTNFKKAQSHLATIVGMLEADKYCIDIMQQNLAVLGLLKSAHQMLMENHLQSCFGQAMKTGEVKRQQEMVEEILKVSKMANK